MRPGQMIRFFGSRALEGGPYGRRLRYQRLRVIKRLRTNFTAMIDAH